MRRFKSKQSTQRVLVKHRQLSTSVFLIKEKREKYAIRPSQARIFYFKSLCSLQEDPFFNNPLCIATLALPGISPTFLTSVAICEGYPSNGQPPREMSGG